MKALVMNEYKKLVYTDVEDPKIADPGDVLLRVKAAAVCGSDARGFDGSTGRRKPPVIMGHEAAGEVAGTGSAVTAFKKGDRITFDSTVYCGECYFCRNGQANLCDNRVVLGVSCDEYRKDGAFAEYVVVPERVCYPLPDGLSYEEAALAEPAAVAAHAVRLSGIGLGDTAAVVGTGVIGLLLIKILRASFSGRVIALDTDSARRKAALAAGADSAFSPESVEEARRAVGNGGADCAFEAAGVSASVQTAVAIARKGGSVTLIGNASPTAELPLQSVVTRQIRLQGSCAIAGEYPIVLGLMARKKIDVKSLISATAPLCDGQIWFDRLYRREGGLLKVVLVP
ncbi:MAG: alcohol dehydrogenase catalytic domain-containing protein [Spirochaetaceae bacterium]|jgi:(R,R)-butanediol dehydrogenase/meso-butanediol dehydrogenase/diacetyl reductase/L-iditol 2-dehydrogenase|nr:alcohol dehydrogenase catalytic domain-containing protein [Spirochaetaceae bacterium]